jgi:tRNA A-37 threonylcarbamoyl transferase component Bud32
MVCYRLTVADRHTETTQMLYGKAYLDGRSAADFAAEQQGTLSEPEDGAAVMHLPEFDLILWRFPADPVLRQLPQLCRPAWVKHALPSSVLPDAWGEPERIDDIAIDIVNYRPEQRCLLRYRLQGAATALVVYAKTFADHTAGTIYRCIDHLWQRSQHDPQSFLIAPPLAYDATTRTIWQQELSGVPLRGVLDGATSPGLMHTVAVGLARLHASDLRSSLRLTPAAQLAEVSKKAEKLLVLLPSLRLPLHRLLQQLRQQVGQVSPPQFTLIHNDLHCDQLLVCGERLALFDFDELALGDPAQDLADFALELYLHPGLATATARAERMVTALLRSYRPQAPWSISTPRLQWYFQVKCLTRAYRLCWQQVPAWTQQVERLLHLAAIAPTLAGLAQSEAP